MSIQLKSAAEIAKLREANLVVADVLDALEAAAKPGVSTWDLNEIADQRLKQLKARVGVPRLPRLPGRAVHLGQRGGRPRHPAQGRVLKDGDILSIDFGAFKDGLCGDSARTIPIGKVSPSSAGADATRPAKSLERAIAQLHPGQPAGDIGWAVQSHAEAARLLGGPPVRRPRHRPADARGAPGPELRRRRARGAG